MKFETTFLHNECPYYISEYYIGFRKVTPKQGDYYAEKKYNYNTLVFMLDGEIEFSYNEFVGRRFKKGDMIFIPQASEMYGVAITDANMLVLTYDLIAESHCSNCALSRVKFDTNNLDKVRYDFKPLKMTPQIREFAQLIETYISSNYRCLFMHELKQKELFIIMEYGYTHQEIMEFFYPIIGDDISFRTKVLRIAHEQLQVKEYADRFNMSTRNFARKFKSEFGESVYQWALKRKVAQIKLKLSIPNASVQDIITEFKFADASHFYRFCKEHFGYTSKELIHHLHKQKTL